MKIFLTGGSGFLGRNFIIEAKARGYEVIALARTEAAAGVVTKLGAVAAMGDLDSVEVMTEAMRGSSYVFHAAAKTTPGPVEEYERLNVDGTANVIAAAKAAGVPRLIHVSTEAFFADGSDMVMMDETRPRPKYPLPGMPASKMRAEILVEAANGNGIETVIVRPRLIWGAGDTTVVPQILQLVKEGKWVWIGGGTFLTSTCHVKNTVAGMFAAAENGKPGECYFLTDGEPVQFKEFMSEILAMHGAIAGDKSLPYSVALGIATVGDFIWDTLKLSSSPPLPRLVVRLVGSECTINDTKARRDLGYKNVISRQEGMAEIRALVAAEQGGN